MTLPLLSKTEVNGYFHQDGLSHPLSSFGQTSENQIEGSLTPRLRTAVCSLLLLLAKGHRHTLTFSFK